MDAERGLHQVVGDASVRVAEDDDHVGSGLVQDGAKRADALLHRVVPLAELLERDLLLEAGFRCANQLLVVEADVEGVLPSQVLPLLGRSPHRRTVGACESKNDLSHVAPPLGPVSRR